MNYTYIIIKLDTFLYTENNLSYYCTDEKVKFGHISNALIYMYNYSYIYYIVIVKSYFYFKCCLNILFILFKCSFL